MDLEGIKERLQRDGMIGGLNIMIENADEGYSKCSIALTEKHMNSFDSAHGAILLGMADCAFGIASNFEYLKRDEFPEKACVTLNAAMSFNVMTRGKKIVAEAREISRSNRICVINVDIKDDSDVLIAVATFTGYIKN
jgi:acyl-CoA thioesterase